MSTMVHVKINNVYYGSYYDKQWLLWLTLRSTTTAMVQTKINNI